MLYEDRGEGGILFNLIFGVKNFFDLMIDVRIWASIKPVAGIFNVGGGESRNAPGRHVRMPGRPTRQRPIVGYTS